MVNQNNVTITTSHVVRRLSIKCIKNNPTNEALIAAMEMPKIKWPLLLKPINDRPTVTSVRSTSATSVIAYVSGDKKPDRVMAIPRLGAGHSTIFGLQTHHTKTTQSQARQPANEVPGTGAGL
jgi:hypothetical protein